MRKYRRFCKRSPQMVPSLEFSLHHADDPLYNEGEYPLATGERGKELLSCVPYYANHPLVQEAVKELEKLQFLHILLVLLTRIVILFHVLLQWEEVDLKYLK